MEPVVHRLLRWCSNSNMRAFICIERTLDDFETIIRVSMFISYSSWRRSLRSDLDSKPSNISERLLFQRHLALFSSYWYVRVYLLEFSVKWKAMNFILRFLFNVIAIKYIVRFLFSYLLHLNCVFYRKICKLILK